jgi:hypothetical protein
MSADMLGKIAARAHGRRAQISRGASGVDALSL